jgi:hypothetical protein
LEPPISATNTHSDNQVERLVKRRRVATACPWVLQHDGDVGVVEDGGREVASLEERLFVEAEVEDARCPLVYIGPSIHVSSYEEMRAWSVDIADVQEKEEARLTRNQETTRGRKYGIHPKSHQSA